MTTHYDVFVNTQDSRRVAVNAANPIDAATHVVECLLGMQLIADSDLPLRIYVSEGDNTTTLDVSFKLDVREVTPLSNISEHRGSVEFI